MAEGLLILVETSDGHVAHHHAAGGVDGINGVFGQIPGGVGQGGCLQTRAGQSGTACGRWWRGGVPPEPSRQARRRDAPHRRRNRRAADGPRPPAGCGRCRAGPCPPAAGIRCSARGRHARGPVCGDACTGPGWSRLTRKSSSGMLVSVSKSVSAAQGSLSRAWSSPFTVPKPRRAA